MKYKTGKIWIDLNEMGMFKDGIQLWYVGVFGRKVHKILFSVV
jgi:hypothetical protein